MPASRTAAPLGVYAPLEEPPELRGVLFQQDRDGTVTLLRRSGETEPDGPPDIPQEAALDGEVFISVDGIGQDWQRHREQIHEWFHGGLPYAPDLERPIIGIHEGEGKNVLHDGLRIIKDTVLTKRLQAGLGSVSSIKEAAYRNDPAVKTIYDQLRQSMAAGRQVTLMVHSGGGAQAALALNLLAAEEEPAVESFLGERVRVLGTAAAASAEDFESAGIAKESLYLTGSKKDPVYRFFREPMSLKKPWTILRSVGDGLIGTASFLLQRGPYHEGEYIYAHNLGEDGESRIEEFLKGGQGGTYPLP